MSIKWMVFYMNFLFLLERYAKKHGYPVLNNVVLPRIGALHTVLNALPTQISHQNGSNGVFCNHHSGKKNVKMVFEEK